MSKIWSQEWLNSNSQRAYPLFEDATQEDVTGDFKLPTDFLLGLYFPVHSGLDINPYEIFLYRVSVFGTGVSLSLGYTSEDGPVIVAAATVPRATHHENDVYTLAGVGDFADSLGHIVVGKLENISQYAGAFLFDYTGGQLSPDCIRPMLRGVTSISIRNGNEISEPIDGAIEFAAGTNMRIAHAGGGVINFYAIEGAGLSTDCDCPNDDKAATPVLTINGQSPDMSGNFNLLGSECMTVEVTTGEIRIKDTCSQACCGPDELEIITSRLSRVQEQFVTLRELVDTLASEQRQMEMTVLGSRLRDGGCVDCTG